MINNIKVSYLNRYGRMEVDSIIDLDRNIPLPKDLFNPEISAQAIQRELSSAANLTNTIFLYVTQQPNRINHVLYGEEGDYFFKYGEYFNNIMLGVNVQLREDVNLIPDLLSQGWNGMMMVDLSPFLESVEISKYFTRQLFTFPENKSFLNSWKIPQNNTWSEMEYPDWVNLKAIKEIICEWYTNGLGPWDWMEEMLSRNSWKIYEPVDGSSKAFYLKSGQAIVITGKNDIRKVKLHRSPEKLNTISLVRMTGSTGVNSVPINPSNLRKIKNDCRISGVEFEFISWGDWVPFDLYPEQTTSFPIGHFNTSGEFIPGKGNSNQTHMSKVGESNIHKTTDYRLFEGEDI